MIPQNPEKLRKQARTAFKAGHYEEAAAYYQKIVAQQAGDAPASEYQQQDHLEFGTALFRCGRHAEAARELELVVAHDPANASAFHKLGVVSMRLGKPERSIEAFRAAATLAPQEAAYQWSYAEVAMAIGARDEAEAALSASLAIDPDNAEARAAKERLLAQPASPFAGPNANPVSDDQFAGLVEFIRSRPAEDAPPNRRPLDTSARPLIVTLLGAVGFLAAYLYVRVVMIG